MTTKEQEKLQAVLLAAPGIEIIVMPQMRDNGLEEIKIK